jgi:photosystem II stability/assembly factor-like uncharacterized protein
MVINSNKSGYLLQILLSYMVCSIFIVQIAKCEEKGVFWNKIPIKPASLGASSKNFGEGFQAVETIEYSQTQRGVIYQGTNTSQIWKSIDNGNTWVSIRNGIASHGVISIAESSDKSNLLFVAASQGVGISVSGKYPYRYEGVYKSNNGGKEWQLIKRTNFNTTISKGDLLKLVKYKNNEILLVGSHNEGLLLTKDYGNTWSIINSKLKTIYDIEYIDKNGSPYVYIADNSGLYYYDMKDLHKVSENNVSNPLLISKCKVNGESKAIILYSDGGMYEYSIPISDKKYLGNKKFDLIEVNKDNCNEIYGKKDQSPDKSIYYSYDNAKTWKKSKLHIALDPNFDKENTQLWFSAPIKINPFNNNELITVSNGKGRILKSTDKGKTWFYSGNGFTGGRMNDVFTINESEQIFCFTDHGIWKKNNKGFKFIKIPRNYGAMTCGSVWSDGARIVATIGDWYQKNLIFSDDYGDSWKIQSVSHINTQKILATKSNTLYVGKYISKDYGKNWSKLKYEVVATNGNTIYALDSKKSLQSTEVLTSSDDGETWEKYCLLPIEKKKINSAVYVPKFNKLFIATNYSIISASNNKYKKFDNYKKDQYKMLYVSSIAADKDGNLYIGRRSPGAGQSNGIFVSSNAGETWKNINANIGKYLSVWSLVINRFQNIYIGTSLGTFEAKIVD